MTFARWLTVQSLMHPGVVDVVETVTAVALLLTLAWVGTRLLGSASPAVRHLVWALAAGGAITLPVIRIARNLSRPPLRMNWIESAGPVGASGVDWYAVVAIGWAIGTLLLVSRLLHGAWTLRGVLKTSRPLSDARWVNEFARVGGGSARLRVSSSVGFPFAAGLFRSTVVVPLGLLDCPVTEMRAILLHEAAHVRRRDPLVTFAALLTRAVFWPLPMAWALVRGVGLESELVCDAAVVTSGVDRPGYARQLMSIVESQRGALRTAPVHGLGQSQLFGRLSAICDREGPVVTRPGSLALTTLLVAALVVGLTGLTLPTVQLGFVSEDGVELLQRGRDGSTAASGPTFRFEAAP